VNQGKRPKPALNDLLAQIATLTLAIESENNARKRMKLGRQLAGAAIMIADANLIKTVEQMSTAQTALRLARSCGATVNAINRAAAQISR
jgi:hypothetical protein